MPFLRRSADRIALAFFLAIVSFQLFIPPVLGLANSGDFIKITGRFDLYSPVEEYKFAPTVYSVDPKYHWDSGILSSETILAGAAVALNQGFGKSGTFDLRWAGAVHGALYAVAFALVLPLLHHLPPKRRAILLAAILIIFTDVLYVSALNSFFMDTAALVFLCLAAVFYLRALRWRRAGDRGALAVALGLLLTAKPQHVLLGCVAFALVLCYWRDLGGGRATAACIAALGVAGLIAMKFGTPPDTSETPCFNVMFYGLLPLSKDVRADLVQLGLDESDRKYIGTHAYKPGGPMSDPAYREALGRRTGYGRIARYYVTHPAIAWQLLVQAADESSRQRPVMGNYDPGTGAREYQQSTAFSAWSGVKQKLLWHRGVLYLGFIFSLIAGLSALAFRHRRSLAPGLTGGAFAFALMALLDLLTSSLADVLDVIRHHFVFTAASDMAFVFLLALALLQFGGVRAGDSDVLGRIDQ